MDQFYRWVWDCDGYTTNVTHDYADLHLTWLAKQEYSNAHKDNCQKALLMLYKWREHGLDEWDPKLSFGAGYKTTTPRDYLTCEKIEISGDVASVHQDVREYRSKRIESDAEADIRVALHMYDGALSSDFWTAAANFYYVCENTLSPDAVRRIR